MKKIIKLFPLLLLLCTFTESNAQLPYDYYDSLEYCTKLYPKPEEILSREDVEFITDSVLSVAIRYKIDMYRKRYNIDSLFQDSFSMAGFLKNPYCLEYPNLSGYDYCPIFKVRNIQARFGPVYYPHLFQIEKCDRFIRFKKDQPANSSDTILGSYRETWGNSICGIWDVAYAVEFESSTKELRILGGCLPLDTLKECDLLGRPRIADYTPGYAELYVTTRLINHTYDLFSRCYLDENNAFPIPPRDKPEDLYIGSVKVAENSENVTWLGDNYANYTLYYNFKLNSPKVLIVMKVASYHYELDSIDSKRYRVIFYKTIPETWNNIDVNMIYFATPSAIKWLVKNRYIVGYEPGFPYYEVKITVKQNPEHPDDNKPHLRGVSEEEIANMLKTYPQMKPFIRE